MPFDAVFPAADERALALHAEGLPILARLSADLDSYQRFTTVRLALTATRLFTIQHGAQLTVIEVRELTKAVTDELYGSGRLVVHGPAGERTVCYFSRNLVPEFAAMARAINDVIRRHEVVLPDLSESPFCARCHAPLPERGTNCPLCVPRGVILLRILTLVRPHRAAAALLLAATLLGVALQMLPPMAYKQITDRVIGHGHLSELPWWIGMIALAFALSATSRLVANYFAVRISGRVVSDLQGRLHEHLSRMRLSYHGKRQPGELVSRVMHDTNELQEFMRNGLPYLLVNSIMLVSIAGILIAMNPRLALLAFLPIPFLLLGGAWVWKRVVPLFHKRDARRGRIYTLLGESVRGIKVVKALSQEDRRASEFRRENHLLFAASATTEITNFSMFEVLATAMQFGTICVWFLGARGVVSSHGLHPSLGDLMAFAGYMAMFYGPLQWFAAVLNWMSGAFAGAERIFQVLDQKTEDYREPSEMVPDSAGSPGAVALSTPLRGDIAFRQVHFSYERGKEVLKDITLHVRAGEMLGLVGHSGAGKSTIINLLCRFYSPDHGVILIDGRPVDEVPLEEYRRQVGIVMQDPFLFQGSVLENIRYGRPEATFQQVVDAAKAAYCHDFILEKEDGYDTVIGEGGAELSGGERQRLSIARAILSDPRILILDEATSAVDSETEAHIQQAIALLVRGRTTIAIAHRLATLRNANRLMVIDDGQVVEQGTHDELMAKPDGRFAKMVRLQTEINKLKSEQMMEIT
jgi:ATP-binding cassette subfamily B protein